MAAWAWSIIPLLSLFFTAYLSVDDGTAATNIHIGWSLNADSDKVHNNTLWASHDPGWLVELELHITPQRHLKVERGARDAH